MAEVSGRPMSSGTRYGGPRCVGRPARRSGLARGRGFAQAREPRGWPGPRGGGSWRDLWFCESYFFCLFPYDFYGTPSGHTTLYSSFFNGVLLRVFLGSIVDSREDIQSEL